MDLPTTVADLDAQMFAICEELPDHCNPIVNGTCVYTDANGRHCLVGEWLVRVGLTDLLRSSSRWNSIDIRHLLTVSTHPYIAGALINRLADWQHTADFADPDETWRAVAQTMREKDS